MYNIKIYNKIASRKHKVAFMMAQNEQKHIEKSIGGNEGEFEHRFGEAIGEEYQQPDKTTNNRLKLRLDDDFASNDFEQK